MYGLEKNWKGTSNLRVNLLGPGPRLKKKIHRAAVSQRLRNTVLSNEGGGPFWNTLSLSLSLSLLITVRKFVRPVCLQNACVGVSLSNFSQLTILHMNIASSEETSTSSFIHCTFHKRREARARNGDQYSLKRHVMMMMMMMMIMIMIVIRKTTIVSTKLQKANKKNLKKSPLT